MEGRNALIEAIYEEGRRREEEILRSAEAEADALLRRGGEEIAEREAAGTQRLREGLARLRTRERNRVFLEAARRRALMEERILSDLFAWIRERLAGLRKGPGYHDALRRIWAEALEAAGFGRRFRRVGEVEPSPGLVRLHPDDLPFLREEADRTGWHLIPDPAISGGLRMELHGGKIVLLNTLESRLEKGWRGWLPRIREILLD